jgi:phosphoribosylformylglycinamidine synthase
MNTYHVQIKIMLLKDLLDPQGKAIQAGMHSLGLSGVMDVRVGKHITLTVTADTEEAAKELANDACRKILVNPVMEFFEIEKITA